MQEVEDTMGSKHRDWWETRKWRGGRLWWVPWAGGGLWVLAGVCVVLAFCGRSACWGNADLWITLGVSMFATGGIVLAGHHAKRVLLFNAVMKLHDDEADPEQFNAKETVWGASPPQSSDGEFCDNPYSYLRKYLRDLSYERQLRLDKARRRLTHFWYRTARMVQLGIMPHQEVFDSVGWPDILEVLELLEVIRADEMAHDGDWAPRPWPPITLLIAWYKDREDKKGEALVARLPARPDLYEAYRESWPGTEA